MNSEPIQPSDDKASPDELLSTAIKRAINSMPLPADLPTAKEFLSGLQAKHPELFPSPANLATVGTDPTPKPKPYFVWPPRLGPCIFATCLAACLLVAVCVVVDRFYSVRDKANDPMIPRPEPESPERPYETSPYTQKPSMSGSASKPEESQLVQVVLPELPEKVLANDRVAYLSIVEFPPNSTPRVWPEGDGQSAIIRNGVCPELQSYPFGRPKVGEKWLVFVITDRPVAVTLRSQLASGDRFNRDGGATSSKEAIARYLLSQGITVIAQGQLVLPLFPSK